MDKWLGFEFSVREVEGKNIPYVMVSYPYLRDILTQEVAVIDLKDVINLLSSFSQPDRVNSKSSTEAEQLWEQWIESDAAEDE